MGDLDESRRSCRNAWEIARPQLGVRHPVSLAIRATLSSTASSHANSPAQQSAWRSSPAAVRASRPLTVGGNTSSGSSGTPSDARLMRMVKGSRRHERELGGGTRSSDRLTGTRTGTGTGTGTGTRPGARATRPSSAAARVGRGRVRSASTALAVRSAEAGGLHASAERVSMRPSQIPPAMCAPCASSEPTLKTAPICAPPSSPAGRETHALHGPRDASTATIGAPMHARVITASSPPVHALHPYLPVDRLSWTPLPPPPPPPSESEMAEERSCILEGARERARQRAEAHVRQMLMGHAEGKAVTATIHQPPAPGADVTSALSKASEARDHAAANLERARREFEEAEACAQKLTDEYEARMQCTGCRATRDCEAGVHAAAAPMVSPVVDGMHPSLPCSSAGPVAAPSDRRRAEAEVRRRVLEADSRAEFEAFERVRTAAQAQAVAELAAAEAAYSRNEAGALEAARVVGDERSAAAAPQPWGSAQLEAEARHTGRAAEILVAARAEIEAAVREGQLKAQRVALDAAAVKDDKAHVALEAKARAEAQAQAIAIAEEERAHAEKQANRARADADAAARGAFEAHRKAQAEADVALHMGERALAEAHAEARAEARAEAQAEEAEAREAFEASERALAEERARAVAQAEEAKAREAFEASERERTMGTTPTAGSTVANSPHNWVRQVTWSQQTDVADALITTSSPSPLPSRPIAPVEMPAPALDLAPGFTFVVQELSRPPVQGSVVSKPASDPRRERAAILIQAFARGRQARVRYDEMVGDMMGYGAFFDVYDESGDEEDEQKLSDFGYSFRSND